MDDFQRQSYRVCQRYLKLALNTFIDNSILNPQLVPEEGPCVVVANHRSDLDPFMLIVNIKRPINWLGASYLWNVPLLNTFLKSIGAIPVSKYKSEIDSAFSKAADLLRNGEAVGIFPEGWKYISENQFDWSIGKFQTGFARIAMQTEAPVVPIALLGLSERRSVQPFPPFVRKLLDYPIEMQYIKDRCVYQKLHINVGKPIPAPKNADHTDHEAVKAFTKLVNDRVIELYNQMPDIVGFEDIEPKPAGPPEPKHKDEPAPEEHVTGEAAAAEATAGTTIETEAHADSKPRKKRSSPRKHSERRSEKQPAKHPLKRAEKRSAGKTEARTEKHPVKRAEKRSEKRPK